MSAFYFKYMSRYYNFCFTSFDMEFVVTIKDDTQFKYICYGKEVCPDTQREHLQGFCGFKHAKSLKSVIKVFKGPHWEVMQGKMEDNEKYCSKEGKYEVIGDPPKFNCQNGKDEKSRWDNIRDLAKANRIDEIDSQIYVQNYNTLKRIAMDHLVRQPDLPPGEIYNYWIYGPPGSGKSRSVREAYPAETIYDKSMNKDWSGYQGEEIVLLDDFDESGKCLHHYIKRWADLYSFPADVKYSKKQIRPLRIIVTSNYSIAQIWESDPVLCVAITRRFVEIHKTSLEQEIILN